MTAPPECRVEIVYALPTEQTVVEVTVSSGTTLEEAIRASGLLNRFPDLDLARHRVGRYGELAELHDTVLSGDRIEIYRPLVVDPKESRRTRAKSGGRHVRYRVKQKKN